jgi:hypothetical protein
VEEKRSMTSRVHQYFCFEENRGRNCAHFKRGKEHTGCLLFLAWRSDRRMKHCVIDRQPESGGIWIDLRWKKTIPTSWAERLFGSGSVVEIK